MHYSGPHELECNETQVELRKKQVFLQKALPDFGFSGYLSARASHSVIHDSAIFEKKKHFSTASAEALLCHTVRSVPQIGTSWHILVVARGWWLVSVTISSNGTRVWQA